MHSTINLQANPGYEKFKSGLKAKFKKQKLERKQNLRQIEFRKLVESSDGSNEQQFMKKTYKRGNRWWNRINRRYFSKIDGEYLDNMRQFSTSEDILQLGTQHSGLTVYYQEVIYGMQPEIFQDDTIRVVYRLQSQSAGPSKDMLAGYAIQEPDDPNQPIVLEPAPADELLYSQFFSFHAQPPETSLHPVPAKQIPKINELSLVSYTWDQDFLIRCLRYESIWRQEHLTEVQRQIQCWVEELDYQHQANMQMWNQIENEVQNQEEVLPVVEPEEDLDKKVEDIKKSLIRSEIFAYFRSGYSDKTIDDYEKALQYLRQNEVELQKQKKEEEELCIGRTSLPFFETDCKVCFCTKNEPSNKVIYCDICNTSFHQSCYGIEQVDEQKQILCDVCTYGKMMEVELKGAKYDLLPTCQICGRGKFPIKNINGHYYHVACLILFDFATINKFQITLKQGVTYRTIMQAVIMNELKHDNCEFCYKNSNHGMQFPCGYPSCPKSFHPICAYLSGCIFTITRKLGPDAGIQVDVQCRQHTLPNLADLISQVYLRRFMCNYKKTATTKQEDFKSYYLSELEKIKNRHRVQESALKKIMTVKLHPSHNDSNERKKNDPNKVQSNHEIVSNASQGKIPSAKQGTRGKKAQSKEQLSF